MKKYSGVLGYVLAITVVMPIVLWIISLIFFQGNRNSDKDVENYINNSKTIDINIFSENRIKRDSKVYMSKLGMKNNTKVYKSFVFYSEHFEKYFNLITFNNIEYEKKEGGYPNDLNIVRTTLLIRDNKKIKARANNIQWDNPEYGTKENPLPLFIIELLPPDHLKVEQIAGVKKHIDVSDEINKQFVDQYLRFFMPEDEFKAMFRNK